MLAYVQVYLHKKTNHKMWKEVISNLVISCIVRKFLHCEQLSCILFIDLIVER